MITIQQTNNHGTHNNNNTNSKDNNDSTAPPDIKRAARLQPSGVAADFGPSYYSICYSVYYYY